MNANLDIRDGNWINDRNDGFIQVDLNYLTLLSNQLTSFTPVNLNENILLQNGFQKTGDDSGWIIFNKQCLIAPDSPYLGKNSTFPLFVLLYKPNEKFTNSYYLGFANKLITLHQLQNLHNDLTGIDLIIKVEDLV